MDDLGKMFSLFKDIANILSASGANYLTTPGLNAFNAGAVPNMDPEIGIIPDIVFRTYMFRFACYLVSPETRFTNVELPFGIRTRISSGLNRMSTPYDIMAMGRSNLRSILMASLVASGNDIQPTLPRVTIGNNGTSDSICYFRSSPNSFFVYVPSSTAVGAAVVPLSASPSNMTNTSFAS